MLGGVPYVPGDYPRSVTFEDQTIQIPRASTPNWLQRVTNGPPAGWNSLGILPVIAVGALGLIADGGTMFLIAWLTR